MSDARRNLLGITDPEALSRAEGDLAKSRIQELQERSIRGAFDVAHLRAINQHIFQDIYLDAGELRSERSQWGKGRALHNLRYPVYYKPAEEMQKELPQVLAQANAENWAQHDTPEKLAGPLAKFYADLDFQHPFVDGNSRTLREFTRRWVAEKTSQQLTWAHTIDPFETRDALYLARDAEVLRRALDDDLIALEKDLRLASRIIHDVNKSGATLRNYIEHGLVLGSMRGLNANGTRL